MSQHDIMEFDIVIVGAGPAGLAAGIRLSQLAQEKETPLNICIIDKAIEVGAHSLSGAVLDPRALKELIPDWESKHPFMNTPVIEDHFLFLTQKSSWRLPVPPQMNNEGNTIISLGLLCQWLAAYAEQLGINVFPGFAATDFILEQDQIVGVITGDKGVDRKGNPKPNYQPGMALRAKQVILAEGCRGSLTEKIITQFNLREHSCPQTYGLGIKELWEIPSDLHQAGQVVHSVGWPLDFSTYGGSFVYHFGKNLLSLGFVVGLDYQNPYLNPYEEFQRFKTHPSIRPLLEKGNRIAYGARTLIEGGIQSLPKLSFKGGIIIGDAAGFLNVPKIKGIHNAMKSGMIAAECVFDELSKNEAECHAYQEAIKKSWLWDELYKARNIRPSFRLGLIPGLIYSGIDTYLFRGRAPWTFKIKESDRKTLKKISQCNKITYPKHDNHITFDLQTSVFLANVSYDEDQPYHLKLKDKYGIPITVNLKEYDSPETRYCPAGVYEIIYNEKDEPRLQINGGNCIHCKACDIKDPCKNITWTPSEGGSGPIYGMM